MRTARAAPQEIKVRLLRHKPLRQSRRPEGLRQRQIAHLPADGTAKMGVGMDIRVEPQLVLFNDQTIRQPNLRQQQQRMMHRRARKRRIARH